MNAAALLVGLVVYAVVGTLGGLMFLGVGFMQEPSRTFAAHVIIFGPFVLTGFVVGHLARSRHVLLAAIVAAIAFAGFLALAPGPIPFFYIKQDEQWLPLMHGAYQAALSACACTAGAWVAVKLRSTNAL